MATLVPRTCWSRTAKPPSGEWSTTWSERDGTWPPPHSRCRPGWRGSSEKPVSRGRSHQQADVGHAFADSCNRRTLLTRSRRGRRGSAVLQLDVLVQTVLIEVGRELAEVPLSTGIGGHGSASGSSPCGWRRGCHERDRPPREVVKRRTISAAAMHAHTR